MAKTAATERYLIGADGDIDAKVELCESQGGAWVTIRRAIDRDTARRFGFNLDSPAVQKVFEEAESHHQR